MIFKEKWNSGFIILLFLTSILLPADSKADWFKTQQDIMGTGVVVEIWHNDAGMAEQCSKKVFAEMRRIDELMSPYKVDSELAKINQYASEKAVTISDELFELIELSLVFSEKSAGAFDITFASVGSLYNYRQRQKPSDKVISTQLKLIDYRNIKLNKEDKSIQFTQPGVRIDLGGIAKGYAVDNGITIIKKCGIKNGMVSAGGDSRILGDRQGRSWMMGVRHPRKKNDVVVRLPLSNTAISTSGDYERFFIEEGKRYHHIIKPDTGKSVKETWSATVMADKAVLTDALSTTLFVLGAKEGLKLIDEYKNVDAIIIDSKGKMFYSSGLVAPN
jgi:FAD:protein FMN transferase